MSVVRKLMSICTYFCTVDMNKFRHEQCVSLVYADSSEHGYFIAAVYTQMYVY